MKTKEDDFLYDNTLAFAEDVARSLQDMAGAAYQVSKASFRTGNCHFHPMMHVNIPFYGTIQGEFILSAEEETPARLTGVYKQDMPMKEMRQHREDYGEFVRELINVAAGQSVERLNEKGFEGVSWLSPRIVYGERIYPDISIACIELNGEAGPVLCHFLCDFTKLKVGQKLKDAADMLRAKEQELEQTRKNLDQIMKSLPDLNKNVDELFIIQNLIRQNSNLRAALNGNSGKYFDQLSGIAAKIRSNVMNLWSVPLQNSFEKAADLTRGLSKTFGKQIQISLSGGKTEIDRRTHEIISEIFAHIIRNAAEHGIESPEERISLGKTEAGHILIRGGTRGGYVVIEISDDGRGLNRHRLIASARRVGLLRADEDIPDEKADQLIFHEKLSSRNHGLHQVKIILKKIRGSIEAKSFPGQGTVFVIRFPIAMSTAEGIVAAVGKQEYIIPISHIRESLRPEKKDCFTIEGKGEMIRIRGEIFPLIRLNRLFSIKENGTGPDIWNKMVVIVEDEGNCKGIVVDEVTGKQEVVVQNIEESGWIRSDYVMGGAVMPDGRVSLILDVKSLFN